MALVRENNLNRLDKERSSVHKSVDATYTIFTDGMGKKYFQIDTYGSNDREMKGKVSQSIQFDNDAVGLLAKIFGREFKF